MSEIPSSPPTGSETPLPPVLPPTEAILPLPPPPTEALPTPDLEHEIDESYPALIGLRRFVLAAQRGWKEKAKEDKDVGRKVSMDTAYMASENVSLKPHEVYIAEERIRPVKFHERANRAVRERQTRKARAKRYKAMRAGFAYTDKSDRRLGNFGDFATEEGQERHASVRRPKRELKEVQRAARIYNAQTRGRVFGWHGSEPREARLRRAVGGETALSQYRAHRSENLGNQIEQIDARLKELRQQSVEKAETRRVAKEAKKETKRLSKLPPPPTGGLDPHYLP